MFWLDIYIIIIQTTYGFDTFYQMNLKFGTFVSINSSIYFHCISSFAIYTAANSHTLRYDRQTSFLLFLSVGESLTSGVISGSCSCTKCTWRTISGYTFSYPLPRVLFNVVAKFLFAAFTFSLPDPLHLRYFGERQLLACQLVYIRTLQLIV